MPENSESARKDRAERLHKEIDSLKKGGKEDPGAQKKPQPESAADFVHRRMREIDQKKP